MGYPKHAKLLDDAEGGPEANCTAEFRFEIDGDSFSGMARYSKSADLPTGLVIDTERGIIRLADHASAKITFRDHSRPQLEQVLRRTGEPFFDPEISEFQHQIENFVQAATMHTPAWVTGEQGLASLRLLEELY